MTSGIHRETEVSTDGNTVTDHRRKDYRYHSVRGQAMIKDCQS